MCIGCTLIEAHFVFITLVLVLINFLGDLSTTYYYRTYNPLWPCFWKLKMMSKWWKQRTRFFLKLEQLRRFWNQGRYMVLSGVIWNDVLEDGSAEKTLKARKENGAFWRYLKGILGSCFQNVLCSSKSFQIPQECML